MSDKNIDKDIEILKEFIKKDYEPWSFYEKQGDELFELQEAIENVLKELETNKKAVDNLLVKNAELKQDVQDFQQALNEENLRRSFYVIANNDLREKLQIQGKELETYKKIAEKLAKSMVIGINKDKEICANTDKCIEHKWCRECIIDWARKEVEKDV